MSLSRRAATTSSAGTDFVQVYEQTFLPDLISAVVISIKRNREVDWTEPHRHSVKATVRVAVKNVLRKKGVKAANLDGFVSAVMEQAEASFRNWPMSKEGTSCTEP